MTVNRTVRITGTEMKETINQFEQDRRSNGTRKAVRSLIIRGVAHMDGRARTGVGRERRAMPSKHDTYRMQPR